MHNCPFCGTAMDQAVFCSQPYEGCPGCGGLWIAADALSHLVERVPERLADLDDNWPDHGAKPPLDRMGEVCPETGQTLVWHTFPCAPGQRILASPRAKKLFFRNGELRSLHAHISPGTLPPPPRPVGLVNEGLARRQREEQAEADEVAGAWRQSVSLRWADRAEGQSWASWFVCGMPLWACAMYLLVPPLLSLVLAAILSGDSVSARSALLLAASIPILTIVVFVAWIASALIQTSFLYVVYAVAAGGQQPVPLSVLFLLMMKVQAVVITTMFVLGLFSVTPVLALIAGIASLAVPFVIYGWVMELGWVECALLSILQFAAAISLTNLALSNAR